MKFKRINVDTVRCLISESELNENGLAVDDFLANGGKTEEFLRKIINMAQDQVGYQVKGGNISIQVSVLPEHVLALTFSENPGDEIKNVLKNLKSAVESLSKTVKEDKENQGNGDISQDVDLIENQPEDDDTNDEELEADNQPIPNMGQNQHVNDVNAEIQAGRKNYQIQFDTLDIFESYCKSVRLEVPVENCLYKLEKENFYFMTLTKAPMSDRQLCRLLSAALEFASGIYSHNGIRSYIMEHGQCIIEHNAIQTMQEL